MISVAIADDHQLFADSLSMGLNSVPDIRVAATFKDGAELLGGLDDLEIDVLVIDLEMPNISGFEVLNAGRPLPPTLVVTMHSTEMQRRRALESGAAGFLPKSAPLNDLAAAIRALNAGEDLTESTTLRDVLRQHQEPVYDSRVQALTARERELLQLLAEGVTSTPDLADQLFISEKTVKNHLASIFEKLEVADRAQAAIEAIRLGVASRR